MTGHHYPKNDAGQTYGSGSDATSRADLPDLIKAVATNGQDGYITRADYLGRQATSPEEALAISADVTRTVPVYAVDGVTRIGEFVFGSGGFLSL